MCSVAGWYELEDGSLVLSGRNVNKSLAGTDQERGNGISSRV